MTGNTTLLPTHALLQLTTQPTTQRHTHTPNQKKQSYFLRKNDEADIETSKNSQVTHLGIQGGGDFLM